MSGKQFETYIRRIGAQAEAEAALAEFRGQTHRDLANDQVQDTQDLRDRRGEAAIPRIG